MPWVAVIALLIAPWVANRIEPRILGIPFLFAWVIGAVISAIVALACTYATEHASDASDDAPIRGTSEQPVRRSLTAWSLADRRFGTVFIFVLMAGEIYTTFTLLGGSGWVYARGAPAYYILASGTVAYVSSYWLLPAIWRRATTWQVLTQPDFFARAFDSVALGRLVSAISLLALLPYLVLQLTGLGIIVSETSFGAIAPKMAVILGVIVITTHVVVTGMRGSAHVAAVKDLLVLAVVLALGILLPQQHFGGIAPMFTRLAQDRPELLTFPARGFSGVWYASTVLLTAMGFYLWPHTFASIFTARNARTFRRSAVLMPLYQLLLVFVFVIGFSAVLVIPGLSAQEADLALLRVARESLSPWLVGMVGTAGLLTALVPGSLILITMATIGARLSLEADDPRAATRARRLVPLFALLALLGTWLGDESLVELLLLAYAVMAQLMPALACTLIRPGAVSAGAVAVGLMVGEALVAIDIVTDHAIMPMLASSLGTVADLNIGAVALMANVIGIAMVTAVQRAAGDHRSAAR